MPARLFIGRSGRRNAPAVQRKKDWAEKCFILLRVYGCSYKGILYNGGNVVYFYIAVEDILL